YHRTIDRLREERLGDGKVGTTGRGIGPTYEDYVARRGVRLHDMVDEESLSAALDRVLDERNAVIEWLGGEPCAKDAIVEEHLRYAERLRPFLCDVTPLLVQASKSNEEVIFEGAQGTLLDVTHGTYPYVTSSSTIAGGVCTSLGIGPQEIDLIIGVAKAYTTRVGAGPFPTEQDNELGELLQQRGNEFGSTTGRRRRCGWLDGPALRYAVRVNGITSLAITKLDVLSGLDTIKVCVGYEYKGDILSELPTNPRILAQSRPIYEKFGGWQEDISQATSYDDLPDAAKDYLHWIEVLANRRIVMISCGPGRGQTLLRDIGLYKEISKEVVGESGSVG
ncbi:MAG: adenylosuccinate synthase, partial [Myxococcales bacterium]|nr:adenylosuccinate synthase [Myxococcales bacterium]